MSISCPKCATKNNDGAKFCKSCGQNLITPAVNPPQESAPATICNVCGKENSSGAKFCKSCGGAMNAAAALVTAPILTPEPIPASSSAPIAAPPAPPAPAPAPTPTPAAMLVAEPTSKLDSVPETQVTVPNASGASTLSGAKKTSYLTWAGVAAVCLALLGGGVYWIKSGKSAPGPLPAETAAVATVPTQPAEPATSAPPTTPAPAPAAEPAPAPVVTPAPVPTQAPSPAKPIKKPVIQNLAPTPKPTPALVFNPAAPAPAPTPTPVPTPAARPVVPSGPSSPEEACGKRVFIALTMCISEQCEKSQFKNHPHCIKFRQQTQDTQNRLNLDR